MIALRQKSDCLKYGGFVPLYASNSIMLYERRLKEDSYIVALNFSSKKIKLPEKAAACLSGSLVISNTDRKEMDGTLLPWEGIMFKITS
jgi:hypothetical protein